MCCCSGLGVVWCCVRRLYCCLGILGGFGKRVGIVCSLGVGLV